VLISVVCILANADLLNFHKQTLNTLANPLNTTDISFNNTLDLFCKGDYKEKELVLYIKAREKGLDIQKEKLFIALVDRITNYAQIKKQLLLYRSLLNE